VIVQPKPVIAWHWHGLRLCWTWESRLQSGKTTIDKKMLGLIRKISEAPRIHGELRKLDTNLLSIHGDNLMIICVGILNVVDPKHQLLRGRDHDTSLLW
jgi:hypothetical protein